MLILSGKLLDATLETNTKTGEVFGKIQILSKFRNFGSDEYQVLSLRVPMEYLDYFKKNLNSDIEIPILIQKPQFATFDEETFKLQNKPKN